MHSSGTCPPKLVYASLHESTQKRGKRPHNLQTFRSPLGSLARSLRLETKSSSTPTWATGSKEGGAHKKWTCPGEPRLPHAEFCRPDDLKFSIVRKSLEEQELQPCRNADPGSLFHRSIDLASNKRMDAPRPWRCADRYMSLVLLGGC